jgi:quinol monooxygenase YgiN
MPPIYRAFRRPHRIFHFHKPLLVLSFQHAAVCLPPDAIGVLIASSQRMFQIRLRMTAQPRRSVEAVKALRSIAVEAQMERGFLASRIYQEVENPEALCLEEDWSSEPELKSHIRSSCFTELLLLMETAPEAPVLEVRAIPKTHGLEYIEAVRFGEN